MSDSIQGTIAKTRKTVVVIEDDQGMNQAIERLLNVGGLHTLTFHSAEDFLEAGVTTVADCLIVDLHLPGLSGFELRHRLSSMGVSIPTVFITAHDEPDARIMAERLDAIGYLAKPFPGRRLLAVIAEATG